MYSALDALVNFSQDTFTLQEANPNEISVKLLEWFCEKEWKDL